MSFNKYDLLTLKNPYFITQIREIISKISQFNQFLDYSTPIPQETYNQNNKSSFELMLFSLISQIIKQFLLFFGKKKDYTNEFTINGVVFCKCERFYINNVFNEKEINKPKLETDSIKTSKFVKQPSKNSMILSRYLPIFIRLSYFFETLHSSLVLKNQEIIIIETSDGNLLFPILEVIELLDSISFIFGQNLKKMGSYLVENIEKGIFLRIYSFISFMKSLNFKENLENSQKHYSNEILEKKVKEILNSLNDKPYLDIKGMADDGDTPSKKIDYMV